jgi:hypothetical protein
MLYHPPFTWLDKSNMQSCFNYVINNFGPCLNSYIQLLVQHHRREARRQDAAAAKEVMTLVRFLIYVWVI